MSTGMRSRFIRFGTVLSNIELGLWQKIALFIVFTGVLVGATAVALPTLVVLGPWGYLGAFFINLFSSATVVIPGPGVAAVMVMAKDLDPVLLGVASGLGGTLGELSGYWLGMQSHGSLQDHKMYQNIERAMHKFGGVIIFFFALIPLLPIDAAGIVAGATRYPVRKFLFYLAAGKIPMMILIMWLTARAFEWAEPYLELFG